MEIMEVEGDGGDAMEDDIDGSMMDFEDEDEEGDQINVLHDNRGVIDNQRLMEILGRHHGGDGQILMRRDRNGMFFEVGRGGRGGNAAFS